MQFPADLITQLRAANHIVVLTGAGISAGSGVPTFREAQTGLWARFDPQELATPQAFQVNPRLVWDWYSWRRELVSRAHPNPGHYALAEMEKHVPLLTLITQNVDGLHERAGSRNVIELHGNIHRTICSVDKDIVDSWNNSDEIPPRCPRCGGRLRPDVVWFGEMLPKTNLLAAIEASRICDFFFSIGTSAIIQPAASLPLIACEHGAIVVEINPEETPLTPRVDYTFHKSAGLLLPELVTAAWGSKP